MERKTIRIDKELAKRVMDGGDPFKSLTRRVVESLERGLSSAVTERPVEVEDAAEDSHRVLELIIEAKDQGEAYDGIQGLLEGGLLLTSDGYDRAVKLQRRFGNIAGGKW